jgi:hypothetical protein
MTLPMPGPEVLASIRKGVAIPASPLALDGDRKLDTRYQRALMRYYCAAGAGGVAVGVHTTQFEIREPGIALLEPVLRLAAEAIDEASRFEKRRIVKVAGVCGNTEQAKAEASLAASLGYDLVLLSLGAMADADERTLAAHCREVARVMPLIGFYLQPAVGGRTLPFLFWREFAEIGNVVAVKIAPFNRYQTLDVVRAVALAGRDEEVTLYTGNDDNIIADLLAPYTVVTPSGPRTLRIRGGLLGQWSVWTRSAVTLLAEIHRIIEAGSTVPLDMLGKNTELTDANAAVFDAAHGFSGCIPGINEVLRRQGLLRFNHCLDAKLRLSPGQDDELTRVCRDYPWLPDDDFVEAHVREWLD